ncbi:MAG TPA: response regulator transcription factor [Thermoanaerobaculia bacterium]|nr:response regulator transcription factor [Thermoanaerobaculia bacterium]
MSGHGRRVLVVEDEPSLRLTLVDRLESEGYDTTIAADGDAALEAAAAAGAFDLVLLDVTLPGRDGFEVCRELRSRGNPVPILMLTARSQLVDRVVGLKLGADDYLTKPFDMAELLARIEALLRRTGGALVHGDTVVIGDLRLDWRGAEVTRAGEPIELSALELRLLRFLVEHRGEVLSRERLLDEVWGYEANVYSRTVDVHVGSLRQKIERNPKRPELILTVHGMGYKFAG